MIYFQFDEDTFYDEHYHKGYFDYRRDGFGDVCISIEEVINSLNDIVNNNYVMNDTYLNRTSRFFTLEKNKNCERVYQRIIDIKK